MSDETEHDAEVERVADAVLATPGDDPGPERQREWARHIARAALSAAHAGEIEWGVRFASGHVQVIPESETQNWTGKASKRQPHLVQRTVSAWQEVATDV